MTISLMKKMLKRAGRPVTVSATDFSFDTIAVISPLSSELAKYNALSFSENGITDSSLYKFIIPFAAVPLKRDYIVTDQDDNYIIESFDSMYFGQSPCFIKGIMRRVGTSGTLC